MLNDHKFKGKARDYRYFFQPIKIHRKEHLQEDWELC